MNHEDFITYKQAVKLKELRFDWECNHYYHLYDELDTLSTLPKFENYNKFDKNWSAPTLAQVQKWLFVNYGIWIQIMRDTIETTYFVYEITHADETYHELGGPFENPTEAFYEAIDKALGLLKEESK